MTEPENVIPLFRGTVDEQTAAILQPNSPMPLGKGESVLSVLAQTPSPTFLSQRLQTHLTQAEVEGAELIAANRPVPLRHYDQIAMRTYDLARQAKLIAPYLAGKEIVFVGDNDCTSLMLGLLSLKGHHGPSKMCVLDFDARILAAINDFAKRYGFGHLIETRLFNVFDAPHKDLAGQFDWFYCNPPFGAYNKGASGQLFIARGQELCAENASGCILLPYDTNTASRRWTMEGWLSTERYLIHSGWCVREKVDNVHRYHLDDDPELASSVILADAITPTVSDNAQNYVGRRVEFTEILRFYGRSVAPPYPRYIREDGSYNMNWEN